MKMFNYEYYDTVDIIYTCMGTKPSVDIHDEPLQGGPQSDLLGEAPGIL